MSRIGRLYLVFVFCCASHGLFGQEKKTGPIIKNAGAVWSVENPDYATDIKKEYKALFDIMDSPESPDKLNPTIETVARYLNMHAQQGVRPEQLKAVMVVHNKASKDLLRNEHYEKRFGVPNPNSSMLQELMDSGVAVIFCGQSSIAREIPREETLSGVQLALSAMTALISLQDEGYRLIKF